MQMLNPNTKCAFLKGCCTVTKNVDCDGCTFCKTSYELSLERAKAWSRVRTLPDIQQEHIANKYYDGVMPWKRSENACKLAALFAPSAGM